MADQLDTPQFGFPFRMSSGAPACVEQGSDDDVYQNAVITLSYEQGERSNLPEFGRPDFAFREGGMDPTEALSAVKVWEPEASLEVVSDIITDDGVQSVEIHVSTGDANG